MHPADVGVIAEFVKRIIGGRRAEWFFGQGGVGLADEILYGFDALFEFFAGIEVVGLADVLVDPVNLVVQIEGHGDGGVEAVGGVFLHEIDHGGEVEHQLAVFLRSGGHHRRFQRFEPAGADKGQLVALLKNLGPGGFRPARKAKRIIVKEIVHVGGVRGQAGLVERKRQGCLPVVGTGEPEFAAERPSDCVRRGDQEEIFAQTLADRNFVRDGGEKARLPDITVVTAPGIVHGAFDAESLRAGNAERAAGGGQAAEGGAVECGGFPEIVVVEVPGGELRRGRRAFFLEERTQGPGGDNHVVIGGPDELLQQFRALFGFHGGKGGDGPREARAFRAQRDVDPAVFRRGFEQPVFGKGVGDQVAVFPAPADVDQRVAAEITAALKQREHQIFSIFLHWKREFGGGGPGDHAVPQAVGARIGEGFDRGAPAGGPEGGVGRDQLKTFLDRMGGVSELPGFQAVERVLTGGCLQFQQFDAADVEIQLAGRGAADQ